MDFREAQAEVCVAGSSNRFEDRLKIGPFYWHGGSLPRTHRIQSANCNDLKRIGDANSKGAVQTASGGFGAGKHHLGRLLGDHHRRRTRIAGGYARHH